MSIMEGKRDVLAECKAKLETTLKVLITTLCWKVKDSILFTILRRLDIASCSRRLPSTSLLCLLLTGSPSRWYSFSSSFLFLLFIFPLFLFVFLFPLFPFFCRESPLSSGLTFYATSRQELIFIPPLLKLPSYNTKKRRLDLSSDSS